MIMRTILIAASLTATLIAQPATAQQAHLSKMVSLESLVSQGFEVKAATGTQSGVISSLVLQREKEVFLCSSRDLSIQPTSFECWPVK